MIISQARRSLKLGHFSRALEQVEVECASILSVFDCTKTVNCQRSFLTVQKQEIINNYLLTVQKQHQRSPGGRSNGDDDGRLRHTCALRSG